MTTLLWILSCGSEESLPLLKIHLSQSELYFQTPTSTCQEEILWVENRSTDGLPITLSVDLVASDPVFTAAGFYTFNGAASVGMPVQCCPAEDWTYAATLLVTAEAADGQFQKAEITLLCGGTTTDRDADSYRSNVDCNDEDPYIYPGATEVANNEDDDCNGMIDDQTEVWDDDGDGYSERQGDCDDLDPSCSPGEPEQADWKDNNCNNLVDEGTAYADLDGDGYSADVDPNDHDAEIYPGALRYDDDGDGSAEDEAPHDQAPDARDDWCNGASTDNLDARLAPPTQGRSDCDDDQDGASEVEGDCNDGLVNSLFRFPPEITNPTTSGRLDCDDDGDGIPEAAGDCNDQDAGIYPGAPDNPNDCVYSSTGGDCDRDCDGADRD